MLLFDKMPFVVANVVSALLVTVLNTQFVARAANTGISGFIDPTGNVLSSSSWWQAEALKYTVTLDKSETFYVKHGDFIGRIAAILSLYYLFISFRRKKE